MNKKKIMLIFIMLLLLSFGNFKNDNSPTVANHGPICSNKCW